MATASRSSSIPRNYGSTQLNFTSFDFDFSNTQTLVDAQARWQQPYCQGATPCSETSEENEDDNDIGLELCYTRSNSSSGRISLSQESRSSARSDGQRASSPKTRRDQDAFIDDVIERLSAYSLTAAREERRMNRKVSASRTPASGEDAALWLRVWGSAHAVKEGRTSRRMKDSTKLSVS